MNRGFVHIFMASGLVVIMAALLSINSCLGNLPSGQVSGGLWVYTTLTYIDPLFGIPDTIPMPNQSVSGAWAGTYTGGTPAGNVLNFPLSSTGPLGALFVQNALVNAYWNFGANWSQPCGPGQQTSFTTYPNPWPITQGFPYIDIDCGPTSSGGESADTISPQFVAGATPPTLTVTASNLTTNAGMPLLYIWNFGSAAVQPPTLISESAATTVSGGTTATFNFPTYNGGAIPPGIYSYGLFNQQSAGLQNVTHGLFSIGSSQTYQIPFGVDATHLKKVVHDCHTQGGCTTSTTNTPLPVVTLYNQNQITWDGFTVSVGSEPIAVRAYGQTVADRTKQIGCCEEVDTTVYGPSRALVANTGSGTVSAVQINYSNTLPGPTGLTVTNTITVGTQPTAITLNPAATMAYVANFGSGTVSEINLSTFGVSRTVSVGSEAQSLAMDPSGNYIWVGGLNYISEISLSSFTVVSSYAVNGQVTSLAIAGAQDALLYTLVTNNTSFQVAQSKLSTGAFVASYAQMGTAQYSCNGCPGSPSPVSLLASGVIVGANYSNTAVVAATPAGFVVLDLSSQKQVLQGAAATPVRCIATDPHQGMIYLTLPSSNSVLSVPMPPIAAN